MDITKNKKIMVVEDDKGINRLISYNLAKNGFDSESVYDGLEAEDRLGKENFDIVILDIMLPGTDGFHICKSIKENPAAFKTFVVILTAKCEAHDKLYGALVGADYYLTKPFSVTNLLHIINELTDMQDRKFTVKSNNIVINRPTLREEVS